MLNKVLLREMLDKGYVMVQKHPAAELYIYNYSRKAQFENMWNEVTLLTRGLILDANMDIVSRPFVKFFNIEQHKPEEIPVLPFRVFEKMDGSLGILYWLNDKPYIASRGSFDSDQARHANKVFHERYSHTFDKLMKGVTYLFEIIFPSNRIVVDYGDKDDLVLLAMIDNATGKDIELYDIGFELVKEYDGVNDLTQLRAVQESNREGFIVLFSNGFRVKMKFEEYCRLHSIVTNVSNIIVWEYLRDGKSFEELLDRVPDEWDEFVKKTENNLKSNFSAIEIKHIEEVKKIRKVIAELVFAVKDCNSKILFEMISGKDYSKTIWSMIRPKFEKPFLKNIDEE
jgi:RNA ligase